MPHASATLPLASAVSTEKALVELPAIELLDSLGWHTASLQHEVVGPANLTGRATLREVYLPARLRSALATLNPHLPPTALAEAIEVLTRDRSAMLPVRANREVYSLLRDGVPVQVRNPDGRTNPDRARLIDWTQTAANDFFLASQIWIEGDLYKRRPDLIGFVNGIPLLLIELKAAHENVFDAYDDNLRDYRDTIPRLFDPNGFVILSNGTEALMGASYAPYEAFAPWKRLHEEDDQGAIDLEMMLRATCEPSRFLDLMENFIAFQEVRGG
jgi:type I restriction enzyme, R subunit